MIVIVAINIIITAIILRYVLELEKDQCECALSWQHKFIKYYAPVIILVSILVLFVSKDALLSGIRKNRFLAALYIIYYIIGIFYSITLLLYFLKLRYSMCECARNWKQYGLLYPAIGLAALLLLSMIFTLIIVFNLMPAIVEKITNKKTSRSASSKELLNKLSNNAKSNKPRVRSSKKN